MHPITAISVLWSAVLLLACPVVAADPAAEPPAPPQESSEPAPSPTWLTDYGKAMEDAEKERKMLLIFFFDPANERSSRFEADTLGDAGVMKKLGEFTCAKLPVDSAIELDGKETVLLRHPSFREMLGQPGIAIVDLTQPESRVYGGVVSTFPLTSGLWYGPAQMLVILNLPPGTLTQRTMIYAVRTHPERPASTAGEANPCLLREAESHSDYQARIRLQGHHQWGSRFPRIAGLLDGIAPQEVCAESWPGQNLVEAAIECVRCWRCSSGHWSAVRSHHTLFGYDMKQGANGVWYATGIFGGR
jgi:hypothetical protein